MIKSLNENIKGVEALEQRLALELEERIELESWFGDCLLNLCGCFSL